jgi:hypothetical protein
VRTLDRKGAGIPSRGNLVLSRALTTCVGAILIAMGDFQARRGLEPSESFFWIGLLVILVPIALALWSPRPTRPQRIGLVLLLGLGLQSVKVLYNTDRMAFYDEFSHLRTAMDISITGHLFGGNPLQPVSAFYPGLEALTSVFADLSGVTLTQAGTVVIVIARIILMLALFMLFERASRSHRIAGAAVMLYAANPGFVFFDAQFSYESLALPLAVVAAALLVARTASHRRISRDRVLLSAVAIAAVVVTHHVTSIALVGLLVGWVLVGRLHRHPNAKERLPVRPAFFAVAAITGWVVLIAPLTISYIAPHLIGGVQQAIQLLFGESTGRTLFEDAAGTTAPLTERIAGFLSVVLILVALPIALWSVRRTHGRSQIAVTLAFVALGYPASLGLRLTSAGAEAAGRLSEFVFIGVAFVIAVWGIRLTLGRMHAIGGRLLTIASTAVFIGGVVVGFAPWERLPFPYRPAADSRSFDPESLSVADWTATVLGSNHVFIADRTNKQLLGTYGHQDPAYDYPALVVLFATVFDDAERQTLATDRIEYALTDRRLNLITPLVGIYVGRDGSVVRTPLDPLAFMKFDSLPAANRIFDSGDIQIFDLTGAR